MSVGRDPFNLLPQFSDPDPDPIVMSATIAQSREAFVRRQSQHSRVQAGRWRSWLRRSSVCLAPAGAAALAIVAAIVVVPVMMRTPTESAVSEQVVADGLAVAPPVLPRDIDSMITDAPDQPAQNSGGARLSMQPGPGQSQQADPHSLPMSIFTGDEVRLGFRLTQSALLLYLPNISTEVPIENQGVVPGEEVEILEAFALSEQDLVAVWIRVDNARFWRAYRPVNSVYGRDARRTAIILDAPDQAEARRRLSAEQ